MDKITEILIGTNNVGKYKEICDLLPKKVKKYSLEEFNINESYFKTNNTNFKGVGQPLRIMLTGSKYPLEKTQRIIGKLPFSIQEGVTLTLDWMEKQGLLRSR